jgi:thioredoxin 1
VLRQLDQFEFHHVLAATPGLSLVCVTAPHCGACRAMRRAPEALGASSPQLHLFEVDGQRDPALVQELDIFHFPSLFLYRDGQFRAQVQREPLPARLAEAVAQQVELPAEETP